MGLLTFSLQFRKKIVALLLDLRNSNILNYT